MFKKNHFLNISKKNKLLREIYLYYNLYIRNYKSFFKNSQFNEDQIIKKIFINQNKGNFVDIGCFHPTRDNNTYLLYKKGWRGINIDLNPLSIDLFNVLRSKDININAAISNKKQTTNFFFKGETSPLNTLDVNQINFLKSRFKINKIDLIKKKIKTKKINDILKKYKYYNIDFMSIDVEGLEYQIVKSLNFQKYKVKVFCLEILKHNKESKKNGKNLIRLLKKNNYVFAGKTKVNYFFKNEK